MNANHETPGPEAPAGDLRRLRDLWATHGLSIAVGVGAAVATVLGWWWYRSHAEGNEERAAEMLGVASSSRELEEITRQYPGTAAAPIAMLGLAKSQFDSGNYAVAANTYTEFEKKYPQHPMAPAARLGVAFCLEALGQKAEALAAFSEFAETRTNYFLRRVASMGKARLLEQLGRLDEARMAYEDLIASDPASAGTREAERKLAALKARMARGRGGQ